MVLQILLFLSTRLVPKTGRLVTEFAMLNMLMGWGSTDTAMTTARIASGPAPLLVHFDAFDDADIPSPPSNVIGDPDIGVYQWQWNFGDDDLDTWTHTGKSKNRASGPITGHIFEDPGTYVVRLRVLTDEGLMYTFAQTITVTDPDDVWTTPGTDVFYLDPSLGSGADSNPGTEASPWGTYAHALSTSGLFSVSTGRLRIKKGTTGTRTAGSTISSKAGPYLIDTYGSGATPFMQLATATNGFSFASTAEKIRIVDLDVVGTNSVNQIGISMGTDTTLLRVTFDEVSTGIQVSGSNRAGLGIIECSVGPSILQYSMYAETISDSVMLGTTLDSGGVSGEYTTRVYPTHSVWSHNKFNGGGSGKGCFRMAGYTPGQLQGEATEAAEYNVVSDNITDNPVLGTFVWQLGIINSGGDDRILKNCLVERNRITANALASNCIECDAAAGMVLRNNVGIVTAAVGAELLQIRRSAAVGLAAVADGNRAYNNTTICNATYTGNGIQCRTGADNSFVYNNAVFSTSASAGDADGVSTTGSTNTTIATNFVYNINQLSSVPTGLPLGSSDCVNAGTASDYVVDDFDAAGIFSTRNDVGAFEIGTPVDPWDYLEVEVTDPPVESPNPGALLGVNPDRLSFQSVPVFKDLFKQCGHTGTGALVPWLARDAGTFTSNATSVASMTDATGYPDVDLPFDAGGGEGPAILETRMVALEDAAYSAGTYYVYWDGTATIGIAGDATPVTLTASGQTFEVPTPTTTGLVLRILTTSGTRVTNIRVVHEDYIGDYLTDPFNPQLITRLQTFRRQTGGVFLPLLLRTFQLSRTNGSRDGATNAPDIVLWSARTTTSWASQATSNGMAWEYIIELINTLGATGWICVHHQADSDYRIQLATLLRDTLQDDLELFIQWSNESSFNGSFDQCTFTRTQGDLLFDAGSSSAENGNKYYAKIAATMFGEFFGVWGLESDRLYTVLDTQASSTTVTDRILDYFEETSIDGVSVNPEGYRVDYMAFAPYFGLETSTGDRFGEDFIDGDAHGLVYPTASYADATSIVRQFYQPLSFTFMTDQVDAIAVWSAEADLPHTGVKPCAYECGPNITSDVAGDQSDSTLTNWLIGFNGYTGMYNLCREYLDEWDERTNQAPLCWFTFAGPPYTGANMYGAMRSLVQPLSQAPKWRAFYEFASGISSSKPTSFRHQFLRWSLRRLH